MPLGKQANVTRDILSAWEAIRTGVVDLNTRTREKYWAHWTKYTQQFHRSPYLHQCSNMDKVIIITGFAARVRAGHYGRGTTVKAKTVADALAAVSKTIQLAGEPSPVYQTEGTYILPVARLMESYRRTDSPPVPQLALPVAVPEHCRKSAYATACPKSHAIGDLAIIAFYYLLRVGEYTKPRVVTVNNKTVRATRTVQFTIGDIGFFKQNKFLPRASSLNTLLTADQCTLKISNQKNGRMGQTIHNHAVTDNPHCPIKALAHRVHHVLSNGGSSDSLLCAVATAPGAWYQVTSTDMIKALRASVKRLQLHTSGIDPDLIGVHSLRAGGAMALKLNGADDTTIMKHGRWTSMTFLQYIHNQIAHLSKDLSRQMSTKIDFTNIAAIEQS